MEPGTQYASESLDQCQGGTGAGQQSHLRFHSDAVSTNRSRIIDSSHPSCPIKNRPALHVDLSHLRLGSLCPSAGIPHPYGAVAHSPGGQARSTNSAG